jgi:hypothetical protein
MSMYWAYLPLGACQASCGTLQPAVLRLFQDHVLLSAQVRLNMESPTQYKGLTISDKDKKKHEGITPHRVTWHAQSKLFFVACSRRMPFIHHLPPAAGVEEDPHAAFAYKLAESVARAHSGEVRFQIRGVTRDSLTTACEVKLKPLETVLCLEAVCCHPDMLHIHCCQYT